MLVLFVNYEDFQSEIKHRLTEHPGEEVFFFSGYDCDSLAYEPISRFVTAFLPFFAQHPSAILELRTKSIQIRALMSTPAIPNCIVAFSLAPQQLVAAYEAGTPSLIKRLRAMQALAQAGWQVGIRLDPLIWHADWKAQYAQLIDQLSILPPSSVHSITLGTLRFPRTVYQNMRRIYPTEPLLVDAMVTDHRTSAFFDPARHRAMLAFCHAQLTTHYAEEKIIFNQATEQLRTA